METTTKSFKIKNSISFKLAIIAILSLLLLIPTIFIREMVDERQHRRNETVLEVSDKWGGEQTLLGPELIIPYEVYSVGPKAEKNFNTYYMHLLPDMLEVSGTVEPETRHRGIYDVVIYKARLNLSAKFEQKTLEGLFVKVDKILWNEAVLSIGTSDLRGVEDIKSAQWNHKDIELSGGPGFGSMINIGISSNIGIDPSTENNFSFNFVIRGSSCLNFVPLGKTTYVNLKSDWATPCFIGEFIPNKPAVCDSGFLAEWKIMQINRSFPQKFTQFSFEKAMLKSAFGVSLLVPVDNYQKTTRSVKYALLFIGLTFLVIFFIEIFGKKRIHPVQYLLTGIALIIFYSLLLSLSEHLSFALAYVIASGSIIAMITIYTHSLFRKITYTLISLLVLLGLYSFLFVILHMSDFALLLGNVGLFIILALIMFFSRKIDWYGRKDIEPTDN